MEIVKAFFWVSIGLVIYTYLGYPLLLSVLSFFYSRKTKKGEIEPTVSIIIAAYNEEVIIKKKIHNTLSLNYPKEKLEIIVVSDGSEDSTEKIVLSFAAEGVVSLHCSQRQGKTAALNRGVKKAKGEIIVFSDANNMFDPNTLCMLVRNFVDSRVGGVCGLKSIIPESARSSSEGDSLYWKYESYIKEKESEIGSITTGDGEIFAIRKELFKPINPDIINDDTAITFAIVEQKKRVIYEMEAISRELASITLADDFKVKARMIAGGYQTIMRFGLQILAADWIFASKFLSHKVLRWLVPVFLFCALIANAFLVIIDPFYVLLLAIQLIFYLMATIGYLLHRSGKRIGVLYIPMYFCVMNAGAFEGLRIFLSGQADMTKIWKKAKR